MVKVHSTSSTKAILFLHGFPEDNSIWNKYFSYYQDSYTLLSIESEDPPEIKSLVIEIFNTKRELGFSSIHVVCHDIGGYLATAIWPYLKTDISSITFICASFPELLLKQCKNPRQSIKSLYILLFQIPIIAEWAWQKIIPRLVYTLPKREQAHFTQLNKHTKWIKLYRQAFRSLIKKNPTKIDCPVLFIEATKDPFLLVNTTENLKTFFSEAEHRILAGGHWLMEDSFEKVTNLLDNFLQRTEGGNSKNVKCSDNLL